MVFVIAEIGINHNGDIDIAKKLIDMAVQTGCDAVKFQKRTVEKVYPKDVLDSPRDSPWGKTTRDQKLGLEFNEKEYDIIDKYCKQKEIEWFASSWDVDSQKFLRKYNLKYNKVPSAMLTDHKLLKTIAEEKKYTFISTGMSTRENISKAVNIFRKHKTPFELMHCVSTYPLKAEDANLRTISALKNEFNCKVGYSGHESGVVISLAAVCFGATSLERHITLDRSMYGTDQSASLEPRGLRELVGSIKKMKKSFGTAKVGHITKEEHAIAKKLREHIK